MSGSMSSFYYDGFWLFELSKSDDLRLSNPDKFKGSTFLRIRFVVYLDFKVSKVIGYGVLVLGDGDLSF